MSPFPIGKAIKPDLIDPEMAQEMIDVGIVPSDEKDPCGKEIMLGSRKVIVYGYATKQQFLERIALWNLPVAIYSLCPMPFYLKIMEVVDVCLKS